MPTLEFETIVAAPLEKVWAFFEDIPRSLPAMFKPEDEVSLERADVPPQVGSIVIVNARGPLGKVRMVARIIEHRPPHTVVFGEEARFVDVQESGPFKSWLHEHDFEAIDAKTTRMLDRVTYRVPFGPVGWVANLLFVRRSISAMFAQRGEALKTLLE